MKKAWVMVAVAGLMCVGLLAQDAQNGADHRGQAGQPQHGGGRRDQRGMGGMMGGMMGGVGGMRDMIVDQILSRLDTGSLPEEIRPLAEELRLVRMRKSAIDRRLQDLGDGLIETPDLKALYQAYLEALKAYDKALDGNEKIKVARARLAEIEKNRDGMMAGMADETMRRELFQRMHGKMGEQRRLNEEVATVSKQDETIRKAAKVKSEAAAAVLAKHGELLTQDAGAKTLRAEQEMLRKAENELIEALAGATGLQNPMMNMNRGGGRGNRQPGQPQPPDPAGLDAGGTTLPPL